jgi:AraC-like DNA-binding protein
VLRSDLWHSSSIEPMYFGLSAQNPILLIYNHRGPQDVLFDVHYELEVGIVFSGEIRRQYIDWQVDLTAGDVWLCGMWEPHGFRMTGSSCEVLVFVVLPELLVETDQPNLDWMSPFIAPPNMRPKVTDRNREEIIQIARKAKKISSYEEPEKSLWAKLLLFEILLCLRDAWRPYGTTRKDRDIYSYQRIQPCLLELFKKRRFMTVKDAARTCSMSRNAFAALFKSLMGVSFAKFALHHRLSGAAYQLVHTDAPLKAIADDWGFTDVSHLHRCFQKHYGSPPGRYRDYGSRICASASSINPGALGWKD